jgi:hypothetical protein
MSLDSLRAKVIKNSMENLLARPNIEFKMEQPQLPPLSDEF